MQPLVLCFTPPAGGTKDTIAFAEDEAKPVLVIDLAGDEAAARIARIMGWLEANAVRVLNVAGPRESGHPGICDMARNLVRDLIAAQRAGSV